MEQLTLIPANIPTFMERMNRNYNEFKMSWWEPMSFFNYPYILVSAAYSINIPNFKEKYNLKGIEIWGDSGGFQNISQNKFMNPIQVLEWQEKFCDVGFVFDHPLGFDNKETIIKKQIATVENSKLMLKNRKNKNMKLYAIRQGLFFEDQQRIFDMYKNEGIFDEFDGFGLGGFVGVSSYLTFTESLCSTFEILKNYEKPIHFFGIQDSRKLLLLSYVLNKYDIKNKITFDSSTYAFGAMVFKFIINNKIEYLLGDIEKELEITELPCWCPVCKEVKVIPQDTTTRGAIFSLHNLYYTLNYIRFINILKTDMKGLIKYINKEYQEINSFLSYIDECYQHGVQKAKNYNENLLKTKGIQTTL